MYDGVEKINEVVTYIEDHITTELNCETMARMMHLSVYEFRRIFSFVVGSSLSEYIRNRRLTLAACEIMTDPAVDLAALGQKYGYSSQAAFAKAFKEVHGVSPSACRKRTGCVKLFSRPHLEFTLRGNETVPFRIISQPAFTVSGYRGVSAMTDTCCCESVWSDFYDSGTEAHLASCGCDSIYACYDNDSGDGNVLCTVGCVLPAPSADLLAVDIPASRWACFTVDTTDDNAVNGIYNKIYFEWLPSANLCKAAGMPVVEVYPFDMEEDGFLWEIRIPINK